MRRGPARDRGQRRRCRSAMDHHPVAARREAAAFEDLPERRHGARNRGQRLSAALRVRQCLQQQPRIRVLRRGEELGRRRHLDDLPRVHQGHLMRHAGHHAQVVRDQQQAQAPLALQVLEQVQDLRLDGDVERGGRLVGDQEVGLRRQRHRDHDPLLLTAGEPERVLVDAALGLGDADAAQPVDGLLPGRLAAQRRVRLDRLDDLRADLHHRIQAGARLLEDHADAPAAHVAHARLAQVEQVLAVEFQPAAGDAAVVGQQPHQGERRHALAAAGFPHQGEGPALRQRQPHAVDGAHQAGVGVQVDMEVVDLQHVAASLTKPWRPCQPDRRARRSCSSSATAPAAAACARVDRRHRARRRRTGWPPAPGSP